MDRPFVQTTEWMAFQKSLGRKVWRLDDGFVKATIVRHDVRAGQNWLFIPYGPELNLDIARDLLQTDVSHFITEVSKLAAREGSMFVKLEPTHDMVVQLLYRNGMKLKKSAHAVQPMHTVVMDLMKSEDDLLDAMHHKHRYNVNLAKKKGITVRESHDADTFWGLLEQTSERDGFRTHDRLYYKKLLNFFSSPEGELRTRLWLAYHGGRPVAGALTMEQGGTVWYLHGASDHEQRALMAPYALHWELMRHAKAKGFRTYDFWGIDSKRWPGVTRFKLGWGGRVVEYPGSFDYVVKGFWRWLYNVAPRY